MKRSFDDIHFRDAFRPIPDKCRDALMAAALSVEDSQPERPVKRLSLRTALIAAVILLAFAAAAFAAARLLGWTDYYAQRMGVDVPDAARQALEETEPVAFELGPMTFTFSQLMSDGHIALSGATVAVTDGSEALLADDSNFYEAVDSLTDTVRERYDLSSGIPWTEAAMETGLPLYGVRALIEPEEAYFTGESMEDALWNEDGSLSYFNLCLLKPEAIEDELPLNLYLSVIHFDPESGEEIERWTQRMPYTLSVLPLLEERTYQPEGDAALGGFALQNVRAERYATGVYFTAFFTAPDGMTKQEAREALYAMYITYDEDAGAAGGEPAHSGDAAANEAGESAQAGEVGADGSNEGIAGMPLPMGMSLSGGSNVDTLPDVSLEVMASLEALPESLVLSDGFAIVTAR